MNTQCNPSLSSQPQRRLREFCTFEEIKWLIVKSKDITGPGTLSLPLMSVDFLICRDCTECLVLYPGVAKQILLYFSIVLGLYFGYFRALGQHLLIISHRFLLVG